MARQDSTTSPRFDTLHELLTRAQHLGGGTVQLSIHNVPVATALEWLQLGLLDGIEQGAGSNPPTGVMEAGDHEQGRTSAVVFTDGPGGLTMTQRREAIEQVASELELNRALLAELERMDSGEEVQS